MKKLNPFFCLVVLVVSLGFVSCATAPQSASTTTTTTTTAPGGSPLNRNNGNGLASMMH